MGGRAPGLGVNAGANPAGTSPGAPATDARAGCAAPHGTERVSVIMPVYNAESTLERSMRSVLEQTHRAVELLVVDDGSRDGSWPLVERIAAEDERVVPIRQPRNGGVAMARNAGIEAATGSHLAFLDSDDWWHPDKTALQLERLRHTGARIVYSAYQRVSEDGQPLSMVRPPASVRPVDMLKSNWIGNLTGMYDRAVGDARFRRIGHEDYAFWLEMVGKAGHAVRADHDVPLAYYLVRQGSLSSDKLKAARWQWRIYREVAGLGRLAASWYFMNYACNALAKRR